MLLLQLSNIAAPAAYIYIIKCKTHSEREDKVKREKVKVMITKIVVCVGFGTPEIVRYIHNKANSLSQSYIDRIDKRICVQISMS